MRSTRRMPLNLRSIDELPYSSTARGYFVWDHTTPYFGVYITKTRKSFVFWKDGREQQVRRRIGTFPFTTVSEARKTAVALGRRLKRGIDLTSRYQYRGCATPMKLVTPTGQSINGSVCVPRRLRPLVTWLISQVPSVVDRSKRGLSLGELFRLYIDGYAREHCKRWDESERTFRNYLLHWQDRWIDSIKRVDVQLLHSEIGKRNGKTIANRVVQFVSALYNKAIDWELYEGKNPASRIKKFKLQPRERFLAPDELSKFFDAVYSLESETTRDLLLLCLFTGARFSNVAAMRWAELDLKDAVWRIPGAKSKNGDSHHLPMSKAAMQILKQRAKTAKGDWVFPSSRNSSGHMRKLDTAWMIVREKSGLSDLRIHDLRRSLASWEARTGANISVIAKSLNHKDIASTQIYARLDVEPVRQALEKATQAILQGAGYR